MNYGKKFIVKPGLVAAPWTSGEKHPQYPGFYQWHFVEAPTQMSWLELHEGWHVENIYRSFDITLPQYPVPENIPLAVEQTLYLDHWNGKCWHTTDELGNPLMRAYVGTPCYGYWRGIKSNQPGEPMEMEIFKFSANNSRFFRERVPRLVDRNVVTEYEIDIYSRYRDIFNRLWTRPATAKTHHEKSLVKMCFGDAVPCNPIERAWVYWGQLKMYEVTLYMENEHGAFSYNEIVDRHQYLAERGFILSIQWLLKSGGDSRELNVNFVSALADRNQRQSMLVLDGNGKSLYGECLDFNNYTKYCEEIPFDFHQIEPRMPPGPSAHIVGWRRPQYANYGTRRREGISFLP
jgi:uncharacterized protein YifE (UPF0438 family)